MASETLVDRLAAHRTLISVPRPELEWLAAAIFSVHQYLRTV